MSKIKKGEKEEEGDGREQQQQHGAVARAPLFPSVLYFFSTSSSSSFSSVLAYRGFIVFELNARLFCFVSRAIRGANCRSYAIAFCFLLLPPFLPSIPLTTFAVSTLCPRRPRTRGLSHTSFLRHPCLSFGPCPEHHAQLVIPSSFAGKRSLFVTVQPPPLPAPVSAVPRRLSVRA